MITDRQKILFLNHFGLKFVNNWSNLEIENSTGLTQSQISQYINGRVTFPLATQLSIASNICHHANIKEHPSIWLQKLSGKKDLLNQVYELMNFIADNGKISRAKGRTEKIALLLVKFFNDIVGNEETKESKEISERYKDEVQKTLESNSY